MNKKNSNITVDSKQHKRGWHQGTIKKLKNGKFQIWVSLPNGERKSKTCKSEAECNLWAAQVQSDAFYENKAPKIKSFAAYRVTHPKTKTVEKWISEWLPKARITTGDTTYRDYERYSRDYIIPEFGKAPLDSITRKMVNAYYKNLVENKVGRNTILYIHRVFHRCMEIAYLEEEIQFNPVHKATLPIVEEKEMCFMNELQVMVFLAALKDHPHEALYDLAVKAGPREGELLGLKWDDIDFFRGTIAFKRQAKRVKGKGIQLRPLKTKASKRTIHIGSNTLNLFAKHKANQEIEKTKMGGSWQENGLVFPTSVGTLYDQSNLVAEFKMVLELAGLPEIRFHDLRHTAASIMIKNGIDIVTVSRTLGHSRPSTTLDIYSHLMPGIQSEAAQLIDDALTPTPINGFDLKEMGIAILAEKELKQSLTWARKHKLEILKKNP